jgi:glutaconate CoA-transferase subunit A
MSVEKIVPTDELLANGGLQTLKIQRMMVRGVVEAPYGAHPCCCDARYDYDLEHLALYRDSAGDLAAFARYVAEWIDTPGSHDAYLDKIGARRLMAVARKRDNRI